MPQLTIGKLRGLAQISDPEGRILIAAMDHRGALRKTLRPEDPGRVSDAELVEAKLDLCSRLAPLATAVLLDPEYGAAPCIAGRALPGNVGLLVAVEKTGYGGEQTGRVTELLPGWSVEKVKRIGASGVKLLIYYHPDAEVAPHQLALVRQVVEACREQDLLCVVEAVSYPVRPGQSEEAFAREKPEVVVRTAAQLSEAGVDVFKAEFPADLRFESDRERLLEYCRALDRACRVPWVILSAGVGIDEFALQVEIACRAGASGFMAGRAVWKEAMVPDRSRRRDLLEARAVENLRRLVELARRHARPWFAKFDRLPGPESFGPDWYRSY